MLKHCLLTLMLAGFVYTGVPSAVAQSGGGYDQPSAPAGAPPDHGRGPGHFDPAKHTQMLTQKLNLTSDQQSKVQDIFTSEQSQMESLRADTSVSKDDRHSKMMAIHSATNDQVRGLLDPDQQKKWDAMQSRRGQWMEHRGGGDNSGGAPPQSL